MVRRFGGTSALAAVVALALLAAPACSAGRARRSARPGDVRLEGREYSFDTPRSVPTGLVRVTFANAGKEPHQALLLRLRAGAAAKEVDDAARQPSAVAAVLGLGAPVGGVQAILGGHTRTATVSVRPGPYAVVCLLPSVDGTLHAAKGMVAPFTVETSRSAVGAPGTDGVIGLRDTAIALPEVVHRGRGVARVVNQGTQPHEVGFVKLDGPKTAADVQTYLRALAAHDPAGPAPYLEAGGMAALGPGESGWLDVALEPGPYVAFCLLPDPAHGGQFHAIHGMSAAFTVPG